jgi:hypothetical protein
MISSKKEKLLWKISREAQEQTRLNIQMLFESNPDWIKTRIHSEVERLVHELTVKLIDAVNTDGRSIRK